MQLRLLGSLVTAGALALSLAACGSDDAGSASAGSTTASDSGSCDNGEPIKVGHLAPLTGPSADLGALVKDGVDLAAQDINADGGVLGRCVEVVLKDDEGDPTKATQAARELVDQEEVAALIGPVLSSPTAAALEVTSRAQIPHMVLSSLHAASIPKDYPYAFSNEVTQLQGVQGMVDFLKSQGYERPVAMAVNNALGTFYADAMPSALEEAGIPLVGDVALNESGAVDVTPLLRPLLSEDPDVLIVFQAAGPDNAAVVRARNQLAPGMPVVGTGAMANVAATGALPVDEMNDVFATGFSQDVAYQEGQEAAIGEEAQEFLDAFRAYKETDVLEVSGAQAASAYDQLRNWAAAAEGAEALDGDSIKEWLESNSVRGVRAEYSWSPKSHAGHPQEEIVGVVAASLKDGILQLAPGQD